MGAVRGTTPDYILTLEGYDITGKTVYVTLSQGRNAVTLTGDRLSAAVDQSGSTVAFSLTQEDTLAFVQGTVDVQLKAIDAAGDVDATGIGQIEIDRALLGRVIDYVPNN